MKYLSCRTRRIAATLLTVSVAQTLLTAGAEASEEKFKEAMQLREQHHYKEAKKIYEELINNDSQNARAHQELGAVYASQGKYSDALNEEGKALKLDPELHLAHIYRGMIYCNKERFLDAYEEFKKAQVLKPESFVVHMRLGLVASRLKRFKEALDWYQGAVKIFPERSAPHLALSEVYIKMGTIDKALQEAEQAADLEKTAETLSYLGDVYSLINRLDDAKTKLEKALELDPALIQTYLTLGRVYVLTGDFDKAKTIYEKARSLSSGNREAWLALSLLKDKSIHRVIVVDSTPEFVEENASFLPRIKITVKNVSGIDLSNKPLEFRAIFEKLENGTRAHARARFRGEFKPEETIEIVLQSRKAFDFQAESGKQPFVQCTVNCKVGETSAFQSQYILDRLMQERIKIKDTAGAPEQSENL
ncbi:MAG: tetratricopeptide repeat protein [Cyanobacteriota/Melainabacteria group bacterium]|nr:tetratricopeptide repeat protein [Cyanobacteria bacterium HKST-UBA01]MCB9471950.1 tetratricopeptide repeat protein [Candidatus Obscuribacterales bacterium]